MKSTLLYLFLLFGSLLSAQTFTEIQGTPFDAVFAGTATFVDIDQDSDFDLFITGINALDDGTSKLYHNDGTGNFMEMTNTPFEGVYHSSIAFADIDGDTDQDLLITGYNGTVGLSILYTNNGFNNFTEVTNTPFDNVYYSSVAFSDIDGDTDQDLLISGKSSLSTPVTKLYTNDGLGNFTELTTTPFEAVMNGSVSFADVDGDADQDVFISGSNSSNISIAKLYINNGLGEYSELLDTPFEGVTYGSIAFADVDGDTDLDLLITGIGSTIIAKMYSNDGSGNFTEVLDTPFDGLEWSTIAFADVDGDFDQDLLMMGGNAFGITVQLYLNDGNGDFVELTNTPFDALTSGSIAFSDIDGDMDQDLIITGHATSLTPEIKLFENENVTSIEFNEKLSNLKVKLFPNPTKDYLNLLFESQVNGLMKIEIFNLEGKLLRQKQEYVRVGQTISSIDVSSLPRGGYIIELNNGLIKMREKVIIQ